MLFDNESEVLHDRVKLGDVLKMTDNDYTVLGCTALIDAIGGAIHHVGNIHKYYNSRNGKFLFSDILKHNELDHISVEIVDGGFLFKKPTETVDPMSVNIETLAKVIRKELQKEHNKQLDELKSRIDEISDMVEDNESTIDELEGRIDNLEDELSELKSLLKQHDSDNEVNE